MINKRFCQRNPILYLINCFQGTPFTCKAYDGKLVTVTGGASARVGVPVQLAVDAAQAGEGNLEITVAAHGLNIPTQVHPQVINQSNFVYKVLKVQNGPNMFSFFF